MKPISQAASQLLADLRAETEGVSTTQPDGSTWNDVYLPNAQKKRSKAQFGGLLIALKEAGYYQPLDRYFGSVRIKG
jgi:hypothetical protein